LSLRGACLALLALPLSGALQAQAIKNEPPMRHFSDSEVAAIKMPALAFKETPENAADYEKYFNYHRPETSFDEAYAHNTECDALSSGMNYYRGSSEPYPGYYAGQYGLGGAIGGAIASAMVDAIFGSAERRKMHRTNVRNCMYFKGYDRYGLAREQWVEFNFEEGNGRKEDDVRMADLQMQARVASGPKPQQEVLEP
jgi:hypothetical protein